MSERKKSKEPIIMISGGTGLLGREFLRLEPKIIAPSRKELDITNREQVEECFKKYRPDIYIHCAAIVGTDECNADPIRAMRVNVGGVLNTVEMSVKYNSRYVYISTEYVFEANRIKKGDFVEEDPVAAINIYAKSKIAGEMVAAANPNHLIIRTSFVGRDSIEYKGAFCDQFTTRDYVDVLTPQYLKAAKSGLTNTIHIGTDKKTQYDLLKIAFPDIKPIKISSVNPTLTSDSSLNCNKWKRFLDSKK